MTLYEAGVSPCYSRTHYRGKPDFIVRAGIGTAAETHRQIPSGH
jgi:hypothetical protein